MTTFNQLRETAGSFAARQDVETQMLLFVSLADNWIRRDVRTLDQQTNVQLVVDNTGRVALPERFLGFRAVALARDNAGISSTVQLDYIAPDLFREKRLETSAFTGSLRDSFYTIEGNFLLLLPAPDGAETVTIDATYYRAYQFINPVSNPTNWLLENHFDIYLYATMAHINSFLMDNEMEVLWTSKYQKAVEELKRHELRKQRSGGPKIRIPRISS